MSMPSAALSDQYRPAYLNHQSQNLIHGSALTLTDWLVTIGVVLLKNTGEKH